MIENIKKRYQEGIIYTAIGAVLISINPYKDLGVFSKSNIDKYKGKQSFEVPPHVFQLAEETYKSLLTENYNQCIIISGESGGKILVHSKRGTPSLARYLYLNLQTH